MALLLYGCLIFSFIKLSHFNSSNSFFRTIITILNPAHLKNLKKKQGMPAAAQLLRKLCVKFLCFSPRKSDWIKKKGVLVRRTQEVISKVQCNDLYHIENLASYTFCSDFRYERMGIFMLGVGFFFLQTNFDFLTSRFWQNFFISFERYCCLELKFEKIFNLWTFFVKLWGFKDCRYALFGTINARYISSY